MTVCGDDVGACPTDPAAGTVGNQRTTILGTGMGSPTRSRSVAKITVPDAAQVVELYGQMAAKAHNGVRYVRFFYRQRPVSSGAACHRHRRRSAPSAGGGPTWTRRSSLRQAVREGALVLPERRQTRQPAARLRALSHLRHRVSYANAWSTYTCAGQLRGQYPRLQPGCHQLPGHSGDAGHDRYRRPACGHRCRPRRRGRSTSPSAPGPSAKPLTLLWPRPRRRSELLNLDRA